MAGGDAPAPETSVDLGLRRRVENSSIGGLIAGTRVVEAIPTSTATAARTLRATCGVRLVNLAWGCAEPCFGFLGTGTTPHRNDAHAGVRATIPGPGYLDWRTVCGGWLVGELEKGMTRKFGMTSHKARGTCVRGQLCYQLYRPSEDATY